ncbi:MAG: DUF2499 domain-containing protein [Scytolyngbya sp. HA4215-MV1]|nr:DUF2499 domain-containing protein [Scytolyngbya sp. HA4215-MV1]
MHVLSIPTWVIHILSVLEWMVAIWLVWSYADASQNPAWKGMAIAMVPAWVSAICVCTWHFFDNAPTLAWLGMVQATMTFVGNCTLLWAAWWLWQRNRSEVRHRHDF